MSDIWSRAWCETQQIPNFALKGITPSNEVRDSPNYIPRVNSDPTQYGSIYDNSRSPSPEQKETLCFQFRRKDNKKTRTPVISRKSKTVLEKVPNFKATDTYPPSPGPSISTPPASPGRVRVTRRPSVTSNSTSSSHQQSDTSAPGGIDKLPDVVANSSIVRNNKSDNRITFETIHDTLVPSRNCAHTDIPAKHITNRKVESDNISKLKELEAENQRLKEIFKENSIAPVTKNKVVSKNKDTNENKKESQKTKKVQLEQIRTKTHLSKSLNCMASDTASVQEEAIVSPQADSKRNDETGTKKKTALKTDTKTGEKVKSKEHRSGAEVQGSVPNTPAQGKRRMSKTNPSSLKPSTHSSVTYNKKSSKVKSFPNHADNNTPGFVFLGSSGQVLAECKGNSRHVIVKNVRSSVCDSRITGEDVDVGEEEFEVDKILASQRLREISLRMEKSKIMNS